MFRNVLRDINLIAESSATTRKKELIAKFSEELLFVQVVTAALDPYKMYNMKGNLKAPKSVDGILGSKNVVEFFNYLDYLSTLRGVTKVEREKFAEFVYSLGPSATELANRILNKDLRCGAKIALFKSANPEAFKGLTDHHPMKGYSDVEAFLKMINKKGVKLWYGGKLDGCRCWAVCDVVHRTVLFLSFNGKEIPNFQILAEDCLRKADAINVLLDELYDVELEVVVIDGEVENINGDFQSLMSDFRRLNEMDDSGFRFRVFDFVPPQKLKLSTLPFEHRYVLLSDAFEQYELYFPSTKQQPSGKVHLLAHFTMKPPYTLERVERKRDQYIDDYGLEGLMLKDPTSIYEHKKCKAWCKSKRFDTVDLAVTGKLKGTGKYASTLGALICDLKGVSVKVGSGFSDEQRDEFWDDTPTMIEVQYQEKTKDGSLRFPTFVRRRDDKE